MPPSAVAPIDDAQAAPVARADVERRRLLVVPAREALLRESARVASSGKSMSSIQASSSSSYDLPTTGPERLAEETPVDAVAEDEPIVVVEERERVLDALDGAREAIGQALRGGLQFVTFALQTPQVRDVPKDDDRQRDFAVVVSYTRTCRHDASLFAIRSPVQVLVATDRLSPQRAHERTLLGAEPSPLEITSLRPVDCVDGTWSLVPDGQDGASGTIEHQDAAAGVGDDDPFAQVLEQRGELGVLLRFGLGVRLLPDTAQYEALVEPAMEPFRFALRDAPRDRALHAQEDRFTLKRFDETVLRSHAEALDHRLRVRRTRHHDHRQIAIDFSCRRWHSSRP